jgi:hypothetical protein
VPGFALFLLLLRNAHQNGPTTQQPNGSKVAPPEQPNGPTVQRPNGPTAQRANDPNVASIPLIKFKLGQPFLLIIAEHDTAESARNPRGNPLLSDFLCFRSGINEIIVFTIANR